MTVLAGGQLPSSAQDAIMARESGQVLSQFAQPKRPLMLPAREKGQEQPLKLPAGRGVTLIPENAELKTVQAADVRNGPVKTA